MTDKDPATEQQEALFVQGSSDVNTSNDNLIAPVRAAKKKSCCPNMTPYVLMLALSVHSIFEGLALGLATEMGPLINMVIAILIHKGAAGSSLGISLVKTFPNNFRLCRQLVGIFAFATPLGVAI